MARRYISLIAADPARRVVGNDNVQVRFYNARTDVLATAYLALTGATAVALPMRANPGVEHFIRVQPLTTDTTIEVDSTTSWAVGDVIRFRSGATQAERAIATIVDADTITVDAAIGFAFPVGSSIRGQVGHARIAVEDTQDYSADVQNVSEGWRSVRVDFFTQQTVATIDHQDEGASTSVRGKINFIGPLVAVTDDVPNLRANVTIRDGASGDFKMWLTDTAPTDWLFCYGQAISRTTYAALFAVISTTFGVGDGSTTFNVPDVRGRVMVGQDDLGGVAANRITAANAVGVVGGSATHTLVTGEIPSHAHSHDHGSHVHTEAGAWGGGNVAAQNSSGGTNANNADTITVDATTPTADATTAGTGGAHNNVQPYLTVNYVVRT